MELVMGGVTPRESTRRSSQWRKRPQHLQSIYWRRPLTSPESCRLSLLAAVHRKMRTHPSGDSCVPSSPDRFHKRQEVRPPRVPRRPALQLLGREFLCEQDQWVQEARELDGSAALHDQPPPRNTEPLGQGYYTPAPGQYNCLQWHSSAGTEPHCSKSLGSREGRKHANALMLSRQFTAIMDTCIHTLT